MRAVNQNHSPTPEEIMEYLDGEGSPAARHEITAHLAQCSDCRALAAEQRAMSERTRAWSVPPAPGSFRAPEATAPAATTRGALGAPAAPGRRSRYYAVGALAAAAAVVLAVTLPRPRTVAETSAMDATVPTPVARNGTVAAAPSAEGAIAGQTTRGVVGAAGGRAGAAPPSLQSAGRPQLQRPAVIRTASLSVVVKDFALARNAVEGLAAQMGGFIDHLSVSGDTSAARTLNGSLRVPSDRMTESLARLRELGQVVDDTQGSEDVTDQIVDLDARLASARATEQRLTELLRTRTGRLSDVLEVERELTRVRLDIERLDAEKTNLGRRVSYATIGITIREERKAALAGPISLTTRLRVAAADGVETLIDTVAGALLLALRIGPALLLWGAVATIGWLALRRRLAAASDPGSEIQD